MEITITQEAKNTANTTGTKLFPACDGILDFNIFKTSFYGEFFEPF
jgi:hypothetical protein